MAQVKLILFILFIIFLNIKRSSQEEDCPIILSKSVWGGKPKQEIDYILIPVKNIIIIHTATTECTDIISCTTLVQNIQNHHQTNLNFHDIGYNFIIGGNGIIFEGVGWHKVGAHTYGWNSDSLGICFIGDFSDKLPTTESLSALKKLIACGIKKGEISSDYRLFGHRQLSNVLSPGTTLYNEIKTWSHFSMNKTKTSR